MCKEQTMRTHCDYPAVTASLKNKLATIVDVTIAESHTIIEYNVQILRKNGGGARIYKGLLNIWCTYSMNAPIQQMVITNMAEIISVSVCFLNILL